MNTSAALLRIQNLNYSVEHKVILSDVSFELGLGETLFIIGPNGSGKSTLLKLLDALIIPDSGEILFEQESIFNIPRKKLAQKIAWLPQQLPSPLPWSVFDFVSMARFSWKNLWQQNSQSDQAIVLESIEKAGITHLINRDMNNLSGGEKQRVSLAALFAQKPILFLLDEPSSFLDPKQDQEVQNLFKTIQNEVHTSSIQVSHDFQKPFPNHCKILALKEGKVHFFGSPQHFFENNIAEQIFEIPFYKMIHPHTGQIFLVPKNKD